MRPRKVLSPANHEELRKLLPQARSVEEFRRIQCVWLRASLDLTLSQIALATGLSPVSIRCYHSRYLQHGSRALKVNGRGGRHRQNLSIEQERQLLQPFFEPAAGGEILDVGRVHGAYEKLVGRDVSKSTVYRLLARHGWRKPPPRPRDSQTGPVCQAEFKENSPASSYKSSGN